MTDSSPYGGVLSDREGLVLQRGGEELLLEKVLDRFVVHLNPESNPPWQPPQGAMVRSIATTELTEISLSPEALDETLQAARSHPEVTFAGHVYRLHQDPETLIYVRDQLTVQFSAEVSATEVMTIVQPLGLRQQDAVRGIAQTWIFQVTAEAKANPIKLANQLLRLPEVLIAEANIIIRQRPTYRPRDNLYSQQWYLYNAGGSQLKANNHLDIERAWDLTRGDRGIVVAVADDSIDLNHPDLQGIGKIVAPRDLADQDFLPLPLAETPSHGTAVAGIAVAEENGTGIVGVAPGCALMPIRTTGFLDDESIEQIFHWAVDQGAAVICCSWGPGAVRFPLSLRQRAALTYAATAGRNGKGCAVVFAAGNFNRPVNGTVVERNWPDNLLQGSTQWLNGFATHPDVITVSACTSLGKKAAYSNWGAEVFITAPSNNGAPAIWLQQTGLTATPPAITAALPGLGVLSADRVGDLGYTTGDFTDSFGGTSSAAPLVAGVIALILSVNSHLSLNEIKAILRQTADKIVDPDPDPQLGLKLGSYENNGHSQWFGYGKVNAFRAVQLAQQQLPTLIAPQRHIQVTSSTAIALTDNATTTSQLTVTDTESLKDITIAINLHHEFLGDLELFLIAPNQAPILLQSRTLGCQTQLQQTYQLQTTPQLRQLLGISVQGIWILQVNDRSPIHTGTLDRWELILGV
jgi:subtilisin family serine protease